jgi:hypothetical protein
LTVVRPHLPQVLRSIAGSPTQMIRHGRARPGHPRLGYAIGKTWMPATSAGMTNSEFNMLKHRDHPAAVALQPSCQFKLKQDGAHDGG